MGLKERLVNANYSFIMPMKKLRMRTGMLKGHVLNGQALCVLNIMLAVGR